LALKAATFHIRNLETRLPFRYGIVTLTRFPLLHVPGYGGPFEPDLSSMIPLERWSFASLESMS
jgi:hypothetical protein